MNASENELNEIRRVLEKFGLDSLMVSAHGTLSPQLAVMRLCSFIVSRDLDLDLKKPKAARRDDWRQDTPRDQARVLLSSIEGDLLNLNEGIGQAQRTLPRVLQHLQQIKELLAHHLPPGSWT